MTAQYLGGINREDSSRYYYYHMAEELKTVGINVNSQYPVIAYAASARVVNRHARFCIEEHHKSDIKTSFNIFWDMVACLPIPISDLQISLTHTWTEKELRP